MNNYEIKFKLSIELEDIISAYGIDDAHGKLMQKINQKYPLAQHMTVEIKSSKELNELGDD